MAVALGDGDHESEVGPDEGLTSLLTGADQLCELTAFRRIGLVFDGELGFAPGFDGLGETNLVLGGEQLERADPVQILPDGLVADFSFDRAASTHCRSSLQPG